MSDYVRFAAGFYNAEGRHMSVVMMTPALRPLVKKNSSDAGNLPDKEKKG